MLDRVNREVNRFLIKTTIASSIGYICLRSVTSLNPVLGLACGLSQNLIAFGVNYMQLLILGKEKSFMIVIATSIVKFVISAELLSFMSMKMHLPITFTAALYLQALIPLSFILGSTAVTLTALIGLHTLRIVPYHTFLTKFLLFGVRCEPALRPIFDNILSRFGELPLHLREA